MVTGTKRWTEVLYTVTLAPPTSSRIVSAAALSSVPVLPSTVSPRGFGFSFVPPRFAMQEQYGKWEVVRELGRGSQGLVSLVKLNRDGTSA